MSCGRIHPKGIGCSKCFEFASPVAHEAAAKILGATQESVSNHRVGQREAGGMKAERDSTVWECGGCHEFFSLCTLKHACVASSPDVGAKAANHVTDAGGSGFPHAAHHEKQGSARPDVGKSKSRMSLRDAAEIGLLFVACCIVGMAYELTSWYRETR